MKTSKSKLKKATYKIMASILKFKGEIENIKSYRNSLVDTGFNEVELTKLSDKEIMILYWDFHPLTHAL